MTIILRLIVIGLGIGFTTDCFAWGTIGHHAVATKANSILTERSRLNIKTILGADSILDVAMWADSARRRPEWQHTAWYHFAKIPDDGTYIDNLSRYSQADKINGEVVLALVKAERILTSSGPTNMEKRDALAFLIHFMADLHQPFHSGRGEDKGGNDIRVNWLGRSTNLHAIWDSKLIEASYPELRTLPAREAAEKYILLIENSVPGDRRSWMAGYFDSWIDESTLARIAPYTGYNTDQERYRATYIGLVDERILQAGYRLGAILNTFFDPGAPQVILDFDQSSRAFNIHAGSALGANYLEPISLKPDPTTNQQKTLGRKELKESPLESK